MEGDVRKLLSLNEAIKRNNEQAKKLRTEKKVVSERLYKNMERRGLDEYKGVKINMVKPKHVAKRKRLRDKKHDALRLFTEVGIPDPEGFWLEYQETQKYQPEEP